MAVLQAQRVYETDESAWRPAPPRPLLTLCDVTQDRRSVQHGRAHQVNRVLFLMTALVIIASLIGTGVQSVRQALTVNTLSPAAQTLTVRVGKGDTLWQYASRYGDPNQYILARVDALARLNHLSPSVALRPGQTLRIPVQNPAALAALSSHHAPRV